MIRMWMIACVAGFWAGCCVPAMAPATPLKGAAFAWHMADGANVAGAAGGLKAHGAVTLGVELDGPDREASLARGGDGRVARIDGGYLALADDAQLKIDPRRWTVAIRMRDPEGSWRYPILGSYGSDRQASIALRAVDGSKEPMTDRTFTGGEVPTIYSWMFRPGGPRSVPGSTSLLELVWGAREPSAARVRRIRDMQPGRTWPNPLQQDVLNAVMKPCFPVGLIGPTEWHDIVASMTGPKLQLWIDGVLVDEEFPVGTTRDRTLPFLIAAGQENGELRAGFKGLIDHVAVWDRPLTPDEIAALSGGPDAARKRELAILGDESPSMQYFRPCGHNRKAGDCIPYWDPRAETFRLYYLILRRNMHSKWDGGHGGLEIWQASTKDLKAWTHHPVTIPITEQWEAWNGTGAVAFHDGKYHWYYPTPCYEEELGFGGIQRAVSDDGVHFAKTGPHPFIPGGDCEVFRDKDGLFHMIKAGPEQRGKGKPLRDKTLVAWVRVADLDQKGGSALTIEHPDGAQFDGMVYGECAPRRWMPGSDRHQRTPRPQTAWAEENAGPDAVIQMAAVFEGKKGALYRNGQPYASYDIANPVTFPGGSSLLIGRRHTAAAPESAFFKGRVLDARVYDMALTAQQLADLKPDADGGPKPVAWYDFEGGNPRDRTGTLPDGVLSNGAHVESGELVLENGGYLKVPGVVYTQVQLTSSDLESWTEQPGTFIASDKRLAICPNVFQFGNWHYYVCGSGVWRSRDWTGPWSEHAPLRLDNLAVPKTAAFGKGRRIYAGFFGDGGWGGNEILRELVQDNEGWLGTRFVPELIPACGDAFPIAFEPKTSEAGGAVRVIAKDGRRSVVIPKMPGDYRMRLEIVPESGAKSFGIALRAGGAKGEDACDLVFRPAEKRVSFSKLGDSSGGVGAGPSIDAVRGMDAPFAVDIVVRHDLLDAEIGGFRSLITRFWNPAGDGVRLFSDDGAVTFRNVRVSPLKETYKPYPGWVAPDAAEVVTRSGSAGESDDLILNYHLMHPGGDSAPGDPNAAFYLDGVCHLHYILAHPWRGKRSFSFVHVTSPDMLHWTWQTTKLQPSFTGHGMFSGTGFITKEGKPAAIYHGQASGRNQIAIAKDNRLSGWEMPYPVEPREADGSEATMNHWDPDCFLVGDTYYAISGGRNPPLIKSKDLKHWTRVGDFLKHNLPDVAIGEDISCPNFFRIGDRWMLLCISHPFGCRYYIGDWDAALEQFVPQVHGRMNWRREDQRLDEPWRDFFAPESVLTPDGRRVMWAWCATLHKDVNPRTLQSLPRELSLPSDGVLRIRPLRELESLRHDPVALRNLTVGEASDRLHGVVAAKRIADLPGDAVEIRITVDRAQAERKQFGFTVFSDGKGGGLPIVVRPETRTLRLGNTEAPFAVADLPPGEDVTLSIFVDKYLVEVFANDRQAMIAAHMDWRGKPRLDALTFGDPTAIKTVEIWRLKPTNQGLLEARKNRTWEPRAE